MHGHSNISPWIERWAHLISPRSAVLDLACGQGRHVRWLQAQGHQLTAVDRDGAALASLTGLADTFCADIEAGPWPLVGREFAAVVVTNYLWRPLWPQILASVAPGGVLLYETFARGNEVFGKPSRPDFLLQPNELLQVCQGWAIVAYEHGLLHTPERVVQRIAAIRPLNSATCLPQPLQA